MALNDSTFSIDDFPTEILERFAPDHRPKTISTLKLVNKRFYFVFSNDRFLKNYLLYPEHIYLCDMKSECKAYGVKDVVDNIKNEKVGRWEGYVQLERTHIDNLRCGRFDTFDDLPFPSFVKLNNKYNEINEIMIDELIDDNNEHWLLCSLYSSASAIMLFNVTAEPKLVHTITDGLNYAFTANLLPGQVMVEKRFATGRYEIYSIVMDGMHQDLTYHYFFEDLAEECDISSGLNGGVFGRYYEIVTSKVDVATGKSRTVFIGYGQADMVLSIWDLKYGLKMGKVVMSEYAIWQIFFLAHTESGIKLNVLAGKFPSIVVSLEVTHVVQITIFNSLKMEITHLIDEIQDFNIDPIFRSTRLFFKLNYLFMQFHDSLYLYLVDLHRNDNNVYSKCGNLLKRTENIWLESVLTITKNKAMLIYRYVNNNRHLKVLSLNGDEVYEQSDLEMDLNMQFIRFVLPNLMVMFEPLTSKITLLDADFHRIFSIENLNPVARVRGKKCSSPSKMVFASSDYSSLKLFHF